VILNGRAISPKKVAGRIKKIASRKKADNTASTTSS